MHSSVGSIHAVVICAQKVSLTSWLQDVNSLLSWLDGCDLRSKSIFDILITGGVLNRSGYHALWFALKKYLWHPDYRHICTLSRCTSVVICAQKVSLTSWLQAKRCWPKRCWRCDLRSKSIFDILITGPRLRMDSFYMLWFALKKYLWHPDYRTTEQGIIGNAVVICAQKVSLTSWLQETLHNYMYFKFIDLKSE